MPEQDEADIQPGESPDDTLSTDAFAPPEEVAADSPAEVANDPTMNALEEPSETAGPEATAESTAAADQPVADDFSPESPAGTGDPEGVAQPEPPIGAEAQSSETAPADPPAPAEPPAPVKEPRRLSRGERETYERMRRRFAACGRCGYFLGDLQIYLGEEALQSAALASRDTWLRLEGDSLFRRLLSNAYGVELDIDYDYYDGCCPECRRRFTFIDRGEGLTRLKVRV